MAKRIETWIQLFLNDFDFALKLDSEIPNNYKSFNYFKPLLEAGNHYSIKHDLYQVGKLIKDAKVNSCAWLNEVASKLMDFTSDIATAEQVLAILNEHLKSCQHK